MFKKFRINHIGFHRLAIIVGIISISLVIFYNPLLADDNDYKDLNLNSLADTIDCIKDKEGSMNYYRARNYCVTKKSKTVSSSELGSKLDWNISASMGVRKDLNRTVTSVDIKINKKLPNILIQNIKFKIRFKNAFPA